jgi:hypothetical protein
MKNKLQKLSGLLAAAALTLAAFTPLTPKASADDASVDGGGTSFSAASSNYLGYDFSGSGYYCEFVSWEYTYFLYDCYTVPVYEI